MTKDAEMLKKIIEAMITVYPKRKVWKVRSVAAETGFSRGKVSFAMRELKERNFVKVVMTSNNGIKYYELADDIINMLKAEAEKK